MIFNLSHVPKISYDISKTRREISSIFLVFSEYMNFTTVNAATAIFASFEFLGACPACRRSLVGKKLIVVLNFKLVLLGRLF